MRCREEYTRHVAPVLVRCRVEQDHQQPGQTNINGKGANHPAALAILHLEQQHKRQNRQQHENAELVRCTLDVHSNLPEELQEVGRWVGLLILTPGEGVHEAKPRPWVSPVDRRISHRGQRHEQVKCRSTGIGQTAPNDLESLAKLAHRIEPITPPILRQRHEPQKPGNGDKAQAEHVKEHQHRRVAAEQLGHADRLRHQHQQINQRVDGEKITAKPRVRK